MSFWVKRGKDAVAVTTSAHGSEPQPATAQLNVDMYETPHAIVVYAPVPGAIPDDIRVSVEGEASQIVIISARTARPQGVTTRGYVTGGTFVARECHWGEVYRRIILPRSVIADGATAKFIQGVLVVTLPFVSTEAGDHLHV